MASDTRRHRWGRSMLNHGEAQCILCLITNREAQAIRSEFCIGDRPRLEDLTLAEIEATLTDAEIDRIADEAEQAARRAITMVSAHNPYPAGSAEADIWSTHFRSHYFTQRGAADTG